MAGYIKKAAATAKAKAKTTKGGSRAGGSYNEAWQRGYNAGQANAQRGKMRGAEGPKKSMPRKKK